MFLVGLFEHAKQIDQLDVGGFGSRTRLLEDLHDALIAHLKKELGDKFAPYRTEIRNIGIDIACYDEDNASLPYPIKITSKKTGICYEELPPSKWDPEQGLCEYRPRYV